MFMAGIASATNWNVAGLAAAGVGFGVLAILWLRRGVLGDAAHEVVAHAPRSRPGPSIAAALVSFSPGPSGCALRSSS